MTIAFLFTEETLNTNQI